MKQILKQKMIWFSGGLVGVFLFAALLAPWIAGEGSRDQVFPLIKHDPEKVDVFAIDPLSPPSEDHLLGTDYVGRDLASRLIHSIRNSLFFSIATVFVCLILGVLIGGMMGFFGGRFDLLVSRFIEIIGNFPIFLLQLTFLAFFEQNYAILLFVMCVAGWIPYCRFTRAEFLKLRSQDFVSAAESLGASRARIFFRHLLPNSLTPVLIYIPFDLSSTILGLGALSFLGFGEPINVASLGELLKQAKDHFQDAWWLAVFPASLLFILTLSLSLFGSQIRDFLDPRLRGTH